MRFILTGDAAETYIQTYVDTVFTLLAIGSVFAAILWFLYTFGVRIGVNTHLKISVLLIMFTFFGTTAMFGMAPDQTDMIRAGVSIEKAKLLGMMNLIILFVAILIGVCASLYPVMFAKRK